jgi:SMI1 / KNR4 family.
MPKLGILVALDYNKLRNDLLLQRKNLIMLRSISTQGRKLTIDDLIQFEIVLGIKIPEDYAAFLLKNNGGEPIPSCHDVQNTKGTNIGSTIAIRWLYSIGGPENKPKDISEVYGLEWNYSVYHGRIPTDYLPVGCTGCGDILCISLSEENRGSVWFWDHEAETVPPSYKNCYKVADSFQALLEGLFEYDHENDKRIP